MINVYVNTIWGEVVIDDTSVLLLQVTYMVNIAHQQAYDTHPCFHEVFILLYHLCFVVCNLYEVLTHSSFAQQLEYVFTVCTEYDQVQ